MSEPPREELADRVGELERTLEELRDELGPRRGPLGVPRPPSPREVLRFTGEYAIPAAIAVMEANIRTLELLQRVIRATDRSGDAAGVRERTADLSRETLARLDGALAELGSAIEDADLPQDEEARALLSEARELNDEIRERIGRPRGAGDAPGTAADDGGLAESDPGVDIDVEDELEQIRDEIDGDDGATGNGDADPDGG